ncbi:MAG: hypothetical protein ACK4HE_10570 [Chitinophagaceae bacterium]
MDLVHALFRVKTSAKQPVVVQLPSTTVWKNEAASSPTAIQLCPMRGMPDFSDVGYW